VSRAADNSSTFQWCSLDEARRHPDWPEGRLTNALKAGRLPWRGYCQYLDIWVTNETVDQQTGRPVADWCHPQVEWERSKAILTMVVDGELHSITLERIMVRLPTDAIEVPPDAVPPSPTAAPPRRVSEVELRDAVLAVVNKHPAGSPPLDEKAFHAKVESELGEGAQLSRERVLAARDDVAPHFKLPVGRPRKSAH
jgi:hypothetical protein